jgi:hypothetical protein
MSETIELPITKPKRVYKRKPKETPVDVHGSDADSERSVATPPTLSLEVPEVTEPKPKRSYTRKPKVAQPEEIVLSVPPPPQLTRQSNIRLTTELIDTPPSSPKAVAEPVVKEKKPRTEKQLAAFNKMREARLAKQAELNRLKELEREEKRIDTEKVKLDKVTEQVINKATEIKKKRASRKKVVDEVDTTDFKEPQQIPIIQEKKFKPIVFV